MMTHEETKKAHAKTRWREVRPRCAITSLFWHRRWITKHSMDVFSRYQGNKVIEQFKHECKTTLWLPDYFMFWSAANQLPNCRLIFPNLSTDYLILSKFEYDRPLSKFCIYTFGPWSCIRNIPNHFESSFYRKTVRCVRSLVIVEPRNLPDSGKTFALNRCVEKFACSHSHFCGLLLLRL